MTIICKSSKFSGVGQLLLCVAFCGVVSCAIGLSVLPSAHAFIPWAFWKKQLCPTGYVQVPALAGYATSDFCVAKYEMKNNSGAKSEAAGTPWVSINRNDAITACQAIGTKYDLISNAQWQVVARNISD